MYELVEVRENDVFTNSKVIAEGTGNQHEAVQAIISKYANDIKDFGELKFSDFKSENFNSPKSFISFAYVEIIACTASC